jgi:signal transduction histidine kinase/CheY-like chemotaxis protein
MPSDKAALPAISAKTDTPLASTPGGATSARSARSGAEQALRLLLFGLLLAPALLAAGGGYLAYLEYRAAFDSAATQLTQDTTVAAEHAVKVLDTHKLVAARIGDLIAGLSDEQIRERERALHLRIAQQIRDLPAVETAWVEDREGHPLVTATVYPADRSLDLSDQDYFRALQGSASGPFIGAITSRRGGQQLFTLAQRREPQTGEFDGVIVVGVSPDYFRNFYSKLVDNTQDFAAGLYRDDGAPLARYPEMVWRDSQPVAPTLLLKGIARNPNGGIVVGASAFDDQVKMVAYKRVEGYPLYATLGRTRASVLRGWRDVMIVELYFGGPATLGLVLLSVFAWRRTRREQEALVQAREAMARREAAEEQLRQAQKMEAIGQLTAGVAHDFNNLLTVIAGNLDLLARRVGKDHPELRHLAASAMRGVNRATQLTHRLLAFSRRQALDPKPIDTNRLVSGMLDLLRRTLGEQVTIETVLAGGLWTSFVDSGELEHSLLNLAINARDAMPRGGKLIIETANAAVGETDAAAHPDMAIGQYVRISVTDSGSGMSRAVLANAFDPFFTTKEAGHGTGLGLSQVYGFIRQSGGLCTIDSELGEGTTVRLYLPRHFGPVESTTEEPTPVTNTSTGAEKILVVEDDEDVRSFAVNLLGELGYDVLEAADGAAALGILDRHPGISLLFTDCVLPGGMNGREIADEALRRRAGLKVLYMTGYSRDVIVHEGRLDPGIELILKPFSAATLADKIRHMLTLTPAPAADRAFE